MWRSLKDFTVSHERLSLSTLTSLVLSHYNFTFLLMESRKRSYTEDVELPRSKKRAIEDERGSPAHVNGGVEADEPKDSNSLEVKIHSPDSQM